MRDKILNYYQKVNAFGMHMQMDFKVIKPGEVVYEMKISDSLLATPLAAHGGALAGMMDGVLGVAALSAVADDGKLVATVEFKINYLEPAMLNTRVQGTGNVIQCGKRIVISEGEIRNEQGNLICKGLGTFNAYPIEKAPFYQDFLNAH